MTRTAGEAPEAVAASVAFVRDCLGVFDQTLSDNEVFELARKVRHATRVARNQRPNQAVAPGHNGGSEQDG